MARLSIYVDWDIYDDEGERLEEGDRVRASYNGDFVKGVITQLYCIADEEIGYIEIKPTEEVDLETAQFFSQERDVREFYSIKKLQ